MSTRPSGNPELPLMAEFILVMAKFIQATERQRKPLQGAKPAPRPRPIPIDVGEMDEDWDFRWLLERNSLYGRLEENEAWICLSYRTTLEIYTGLFRKVDPAGVFKEASMIALNDALWDYGFRTIEGESKEFNHTWFLPESVH